MTYPGIGTTNPIHQLETTSNVTAESLEIYSDYTFFSSSDYDWARQLRLRVNTPAPTSSNVFVDMGLEKDDGAYFYISKPLSGAADPKNNFRIYQNGRILINRTDESRSERLQIGGDVKVTGNLNVTGTTAVYGDVDITGDLHVTSFNQEKNYIVPVGMIVMWDGAVADIPPGWELVTGVSGYYLKSDPNQTSVQTGGSSSFTINKIPNHIHNETTLQISTNSHDHNSGATTLSGNQDYHKHNVASISLPEREHKHNYYFPMSGNQTAKDGGSYYVNVVSANTTLETTGNAYDNHTHTVLYTPTTNISDEHTHSHNFNSTGLFTGFHNHNSLNNTGINQININLTPQYRQIILIKKLAYL